MSLANISECLSPFNLNLSVIPTSITFVSSISLCCVYRLAVYYVFNPSRNRKIACFKFTWVDNRARNSRRLNIICSKMTPLRYSVTPREFLFKSSSPWTADGLVHTFHFVRRQPCTQLHFIPGVSLVVILRLCRCILVRFSTKRCVRALSTFCQALYWVAGLLQSMYNTSRGDTVACGRRWSNGDDRVAPVMACFHCIMQESLQADDPSPREWNYESVVLTQNTFRWLRFIWPQVLAALSVCGAFHSVHLVPYSVCI